MTVVAGRHGTNVNISIDDGDEFADCSDLSVRFDGDRAAVTSEEIPFHGSQLRVTTAHNGGGIRVVGTRGNAYGVTLCKAVAPGVDPGSVRAVLAGNELTARGPENDRWVGYFLIRAPRGASLDLNASNGPISIADFNGTVTAEAVNGPVSVKESSGTINARTTNGPVSVSGGSGQIKLDATNGPISVKLAGTAWDGNLDASTQNGPVSLKLPRGFRTGVLVQSLGSGPITCRAEGCPDLRASRYDRHEDRPRRIELGSGPQNVRVSTVNGPVSVKESE
jgi:hypothetical protein